MFDIGGPELLLILLAVIVLFGPKKIPEMAQMVGKGLKKVKQAQQQFQLQIDEIKTEIQQTGDPQKSIPSSDTIPEYSELVSINNATELMQSNDSPALSSQKFEDKDIDKAKNIKDDDGYQNRKDNEKDELNEFRYPDDYSVSSRSSFTVKQPKISPEIDDDNQPKEGITGKTHL